MKHQTYIAGVKHRPGAWEALDAMTADDFLTLEPDPLNQYDPHAVKIMLGDVHVGFVPKDLAPEIGDLIAAGRIQSVEKTGASGIHIHYRDKNNDD